MARSAELPGRRLRRDCHQSQRLSFLKLLGKPVGQALPDEIGLRISGHEFSAALARWDFVRQSLIYRASSRPAACLVFGQIANMPIHEPSHSNEVARSPLRKLDALPDL